VRRLGVKPGAEAPVLFLSGIQEPEGPCSLRLNAYLPYGNIFQKKFAAFLPFQSGKKAASI
jgi:hypothetical protein